MSVSCSRLEASSSWPVDRHSSECGGAAERDLYQGAFSGEGGAELVGGVGDEASLCLEGSLEACEEVVEGVGEFFEFVVGPVEAEAFVQVGGGDPACGAGDRSDGAQHPAGDEPAGEDGEDGDRGERDS